MKKAQIISLLLVVLGISVHSAYALDESRLRRGVNLWEWFSQGDGVRGVPSSKWREDLITPWDVQRLKRARISAVRIGVNPYSLLPSPLPNAPGQFRHCRTLHDLPFVRDLEQGIRMFVSKGMAVIVNIRFEGPAKRRLSDETFATRCLGPFWAALARELAGKFDARDLFFDLINEPDIIVTMPLDSNHWAKSAALWSSIQARWVAIIRHSISEDYTLILSADGWDTAEGVPYMTWPHGRNLILELHYYRNEVFTHQGQSWYQPLIGRIAGLAYPPEYESCRTNLNRLRSFFREPWYKQLRSYCSGRWAMASDMKPVLQWSHRNGNVPILVGEFGALAPAPLSSRLRWYRSAITQFRQNGFIGYFLPDYVDPVGCNRLADTACADVLQR